MNYEELLIEADNNNLITKEKPLLANAGRIKGNRIAIKQDLPTQTEKACVLAEELGHFYTSTGNIIDQKDISNRKQERAARLWAYNKQIGLSGLIHCFEAHCQNIHEMADHLDVTEAFLQDALKCYRQKYGICTSYQQYTIYFEPKLAIYKTFDNT